MIGPGKFITDTALSVTRMLLFGKKRHVCL